MVSASRQKVKYFMKTAKIQIIIWFFLVVGSVGIYKYLTAKSDLQILSETGVKDEVLAFIRQQNADLLDDKTKLERERISLELLNLKKYQAKARLDIERVKLYADVSLYGLIFLIGCTGLSGIIFVSAIYREKDKRASVHTYQIGQHNSIVIHERDLHVAGTVALGLVNAQQMRQVNGGVDKALSLCQAIAAMQHKQISQLAQAALPEQAQDAIDLPMRTPAFRDLLNDGAFVEGGDLLCGFDSRNEPQTRSMDDLKAISVAGWQGSGKTLSMAYLTACSLIQCPGSFAYILDPHDKHKEGLGNILRPLEKTGRLKVVSKFEISNVIAHLDKVLDDRLEGRSSSGNRIILVIDELARLSGLPCFDTILSFVERCTNEIRKANILFIAGSTKWTARHFKGRADIRGTMPSSLVHHTKMSQAKLILEDMDKDTKALLKQVDRPGTALLSTSSRVDPSLIHVPLITPADIYQVAELLQVANDKNGSSENFLPVDKCGVLGVDKMESEEIQPPSNVVKFQRVEKTEVNENSTAKSTVDKKNEETQKIIEIIRKSISEKRTTLGEISRQTKVDKAWLSKIINGGKTELMSENIRRKLSELCEG